MNAEPRRRRRIPDAFYYRSLFILANLFVAAAACVPGQDIPEIVTSLNDKLLHALQYAVFFGLTVKALGTYSEHSALRLLRGPLAMGWSLAAGILTELLQTQVPGRRADPADAAANAAGILTGYLLWRLISRRKKNSPALRGLRGNI